MNGTYNLRAEMVRRSQDAMLHAAHERRVALGLVDLPEDEAQLRIRALDVLSSAQLLALVQLPSDEREGQIRALVAAQRRRHYPIEVAATGINDGTGEVMFCWACPCGRSAPGDLSSAKEARDGGARHVVGAPAAVGGKVCGGCGEPIPPGAGRYCSRECRRAATGATLEPTE